MKKYTKKISLTKNNRGVWDLDPFKGCIHGMIRNPNGCYGICYAAKIAKFRGYDFGNMVKRDFVDDKHFKSIANKLKTIPFVRLGVSCDPSSDWKHTLKIIYRIRPYQKNIVIITKHWNELQDCQLKNLKGLTINTSVSAFDNKYELEKRMYWYKKLKKYCNSVLRVCTANFEFDQAAFEFYNEFKFKKLQEKLLLNDKVIDNVLRFPKSNILSKKEIINVKKYKFLNAEINASKHSENVFFGYCKDCLEQCGINL